MKIGAMCLRTVGQVTFLEDSNGIISVDIAKLVRPSKANDDISRVVAAQFIADAVNHYAKALYEESLNIPDENTVTPSCGCVFCDLGLKPTNGWHQTVDLEPIRCPLA